MNADDNLEFTVVPPAAVEYVWVDVEPILAKAVETSGGRYHTASVLDSLLKQEMVLWMVLDDVAPIAVVTTRIVQMPRGRALAMDWLAGERMREWLPLVHHTLMKYARDNGCTEMQAFGRKAWGRWLHPHGWKPDYIAYKMELSDG